MFEIPAAVKAFEQSTLPALQPAASDVFDFCEDLQLVRTRGWSRQTSDDSESSSYALAAETVVAADGFEPTVSGL